MQVPVFNHAGETVGQIDLRDDIFGIKPNESVMHQALLRQLANARQGNADTKTRGEVAGGGRKPWRQKGTGRARQGSTRAPHWKGGGRVFGPHPRSYAQRMPKKMRHLALRSALSVKAAGERIRVLDAFAFEAPRTRDMDALLGTLNCPTTALIVLPAAEDFVVRSARNLKGVKTLHASYLNIRDLLKYDYLVMTRAGLDAVNQLLGNEAAETEKQGE